MTGIFAKKLVILLKTGERIDYTHVTNLMVRTLRHGAELYVTAEGSDEHGMRRNIARCFAVKDIHMTIVDWYEPPR